MLLELMHALEKNMYCAYAGSCLRPSAFATAAVAFYKSNRKVSAQSERTAKQTTKRQQLVLRSNRFISFAQCTIHLFIHSLLRFAFCPPHERS